VCERNKQAEAENQKNAGYIHALPLKSRPLANHSKTLLTLNDIAVGTPVSAEIFPAMSVSRAPWSWPLLWVALAVGYFFTGRLCISISAQVANVSWMLFIPAGLSLSVALLWGSRVWPGIFFGELTLVLVTGQPVPSALLMATGNALEAALAGWWFFDRLGRRIEFDRLKDVVQLLVATVLVLQPMSTTFGMIALTLAGHLPRAQIGATASAWYAADLFAQLVAAPAVIVWLRWSRPASTRAARFELIGLTVLTLILGAFGAGRWATHGLPLPVTLIFVFPLLVWASVRFVPSVAISAGTILGLFAFDAVLAGAGPFRGAANGNHIFYLNLFMGVCIGTALFLAAAMGESRRFEAEQARLIAELKSSADQVRRLEEFVTFCAWTGRVRWNDQWVSVETFLHERYNLNISHGISEEALTGFLKDLPPLLSKTVPTLPGPAPASPA
jgi:integral membrane sensor domain MASE1